MRQSLLPRLFLYAALGLCSWSASAQETSKVIAPPTIASLVERAKDGSIPIPGIHSQSYCSRLPDAEQDACATNNQFGLTIYEALTALHLEIEKYSITQFSQSIYELAYLRDTLWKQRAFENVVLANLINQMIYWNLVVRISQSPRTELPAIEPLLAFFRPITNDWQTVIEAVEADGSLKIKLEIPAPLNISNIYAQAALKLPQQQEESFTGTTPIKEAFDTPPYSRWATDVCFLSNSQRGLKYYFLLRSGVDKFPASEGRVIISKTATGKPIFVDTAEFFDKRVPLVIPQALKEREPNWSENNSPSTFYWMFHNAMELRFFSSQPIEQTYIQ